MRISCCLKTVKGHPWNFRATEIAKRCKPAIRAVKIDYEKHNATVRKTSNKENLQLYYRDRNPSSK